MGVEVDVVGLTKSFGSQEIWRDVTFHLPAGEVSVLLGPSGTGKSVFLKSVIGLLKPERGSCHVAGVDTVACSAKELYEVRKLFGVLFQDGALFGSMNLYDNVAFPLREHTRKSESEIRKIVKERMDMVGLDGADDKLPGQISGGMKKRAGLARALVLDPEILLVDEPDSGLDPVRTAYISQLLIDINTQMDTTILIVTHNINLARTVPDNLGMLYRRELVGFGPREVLLTSNEPVIAQFLNGRRFGPIGMSEEKDQATAELEQELARLGHADGSGGVDMVALVDQLQPTPGLGVRAAVSRRMHRLGTMLPHLPEVTRAAAHEVLSRHRISLPGHDGYSNRPEGAGEPTAETAPQASAAQTEIVPGFGRQSSPARPAPQAPARAPQRTGRETAREAQRDQRQRPGNGRASGQRRPPSDAGGPTPAVRRPAVDRDATPSARPPAEPTARRSSILGRRGRSRGARPGSYSTERDDRAS